jgi:hypothetical protein
MAPLQIQSLQHLFDVPQVLVLFLPIDPSEGPQLTKQEHLARNGLGQREEQLLLHHMGGRPNEN